jgi:hypothetical protein
MIRNALVEVGHQLALVSPDNAPCDGKMSLTHYLSCANQAV